MKAIENIRLSRMYYVTMGSSLNREIGQNLRVASVSVWQCVIHTCDELKMGFKEIFLSFLTGRFLKNV